MIKKFIGRLIVLCVVAVVVMTLMNYGNYSSMLPKNLFSRSSSEAVVSSQTDAQTQVQTAADAPKQ